MKYTSVKRTASVKAFALILCVAAWPLVCGVTGCSTGNRYKQSTGEYIDDRGLTSHVKTALAEDHQYKYDDVNVTTFKGVVQLSGFVNHITAGHKRQGRKLFKRLTNFRLSV